MLKQRLASVFIIWYDIAGTELPGFEFYICGRMV